MDITEIKEKIIKADSFILCKSELFLQTETGETIDTIYPVAIELVPLIAEIFDKDAFTDGGTILYERGTNK